MALQQLPYDDNFLYTATEPVPYSLSVTFENSQSANVPTNYDYSLLLLIISKYEVVTDVPADKAGFSSSIAFLVVVYLVHGITKSEVRIIIVGY